MIYKGLSKVRDSYLPTGAKSTGCRIFSTSAFAAPSFLPSDFSTASVRTAAFRTIEFSNVDLDTACSTAAFSTADLDAAFSIGDLDAACSTTDLSAAACSTAGFSKADHDAAFSADTSTTATAIAPRSLDRVRNQLGLTSTLVQVELVGLPLPLVRRSAPRRRDHAISGWFGLQMTSAAPRRVAAGSLPAESDASNRAVASIGDCHPRQQ